MFEDGVERIGVFDFDEFADHLLDQGLDASPSELHGCITGLLAGNDKASPEQGIAVISNILGIELTGELAAQTLELHKVTAASLRDEQFDFHPLLPGDDDELELRVLALSGWTRGFMAGLAAVVAAVGVSALPTGAAEILKDFSAITEAGVDMDEEDEDELERHYMELVEYLRYAVLNIAQDCLVEVPDEGSPPPALH